MTLKNENNKESSIFDKKIMFQSITTVILFFILNFGLWEILVDKGMNKSWASFTVYAVLVIITIFIWHKKLLCEWHRFKNEMKSWKRFLIELLIVLIIATAFSYLFQYLINGNFKTDNTETVGEMVDTIPPILSGIMISLFGPIIEELTFRESLIGGINTKKQNGYNYYGDNFCYCI